MTTWLETEFVYDPGEQRWLTGTCGPNALTMGENFSAQHYGTSTDQTFERMHAAGRCDSNGAATAWSVYEQALADGYHATLLPYAEPMAQSVWQSFLDEHLAVGCAVIIETSNGQALIDADSGKGENAKNLQYHFFCVVRAGYLCLDGDNFSTPLSGVSTSIQQWYPLGTIAASRPCAMVAIYPKVSVTMAWTKQADGTGKDTHDNHCGAGDMAYLESSGLAASDGMMSETAYAGPNTFLPLANGHVVTASKNSDGSWTVGEDAAGVVMSLHTQLQAAEKGNSGGGGIPEPYVAAKAAVDALSAAQAAK